MKKYLYLIALLISFNALANDQRFEAANSLYAKGEFAQAAQAYEDIIKTGVESEALLFNLGNAYYKQAKLPQAILNFERALLLDPDDKDIVYNLDLANSQTADRIVPVGQFFLNAWVKGLINKGSSDFWAWLAILSFAFCLAMIGVYVYLANPLLKRTSFYSAIVLLLIVVLSITFSSSLKKQITNRNQGIVFSSSVSVKSSPDMTGTDLFVIHEGTKVKILEKLGAWSKVQLKDGSEGWLQQQTIEII